MSVPRNLTATSVGLVGVLALAGCAGPGATAPTTASVAIEEQLGNA